MCDDSNDNEHLNKLISIVVPVYKVENYLERCIKSIVMQTYKNIEIILVDDGSPDMCGEICDNWKAKDTRIRVIHKANGGLSDARNAGIEAAKGEYIAFVDSDDFILSKYIEKLYEMISQNDADISVCDILRLYPEEITHNFKEAAEGGMMVCNGIAVLKQMFFNDNYQKVIVAWNKLYKIELFNGIRYPIGKINEDGFTTHRLLYKAEKVVLTNEKLYAYVLTPNSITRCRYNLKHLDDLEGFEARNEFFYHNKEFKLYRLSLSWYMYPLRIQYYRCRYYYPDLNVIYDQIWEKYVSTLKKTIFYMEMPLRRKLSMIFTYLFREYYFEKFIKDNRLGCIEIENFE